MPGLGRKLLLRQLQDFILLLTALPTFFQSLVNFLLASSTNDVTAIGGGVNNFVRTVSKPNYLKRDDGEGFKIV